MGGRRAAQPSSPRTSTSSSWARPPRRRTPTSRPPSVPPWLRRRRGASCPSTSAPRCSCAPPTCSRRPGAIGSTQPPCSASRRPSSRPRSTPRASSPTSCASTSTSRARSSNSSRSARPVSGTGWSIARSRASSSRSPPSTSPRSPATCRPRRRILGNVVVWKPSPTQQLAAHHTMRLFEAAGLPPGVINVVTGDGAAVSEVALRHPALAGVHFTGSTATFQHLWREIGSNDRVVRRATRGWSARRAARTSSIAHPSADPAALVTGPGPRRVRVPGSEVLGGIARLRPALAVGRRASATTWSRRPSRSPTATSPTSPTSAAP